MKYHSNFEEQGQECSKDILKKQKIKIVNNDKKKMNKSRK